MGLPCPQSKLHMQCCFSIRHFTLTYTESICVGAHVMPCVQYVVGLGERKIDTLKHCNSETNLKNAELIQIQFAAEHASGTEI